ncbi:class I SAM-dependent methyltransferase [Treponema sp.]|uniref:class I SAM-dependent methyltransferase n=1 Tax=Treponema sp. TaxID=166 RepID=UPI003F01CBA9
MQSENTNKCFWQRFAKLYAPFMKKNSGTYSAISKKIAPYITEDKTVLELACGTGQLTFLLAEHSGSWKATDYSENMIAEIKKLASARLANATFEVQDATDLHYADSQFDVVLIANTLHIMPQPEKALREIFRVLKDGGILLAPTFVYEKGSSNFQILVMEKIGFKTYHKWSAEELCAAVSSGGFEVISCDVIKGKPLSECVLVAAKKI